MEGSKIKQFGKMIEAAKHIVYFTGAGVSTHSGIPDFRSGQGLFMHQFGTLNPERIVSADFFQTYPALFFSYYFDHLVYPNAQPNLAHDFAKQLEDLGKSVTVITQNIDGLHQKAGSRSVIELHGSIWSNHCIQCGKHFSLDALTRDQDGIPRCDLDGAIVKPKVVLYQESLDPIDLDQAVEAIAAADLILVLGTSLSVYPAAGLLQYRSNKSQLVLINRGALAGKQSFDLAFDQDMVQVLSQIDLG